MNIHRFLMRALHVGDVGLQHRSMNIGVWRFRGWGFRVGRFRVGGFRVGGV